MKNSLGARIAEKRKEKGIKQEELAECLGVSAQAVSKWENDLSCPDIMTLPALARRLGVTVDELLTGEKAAQAVAFVPEAERRDFNELVLRIDVICADGEQVKITLPMPLVKLGLEAGMKFSSFGAGKVDKMEVDWQKIINLAEKGVIGTLVEVVCEDGDKIKVVVE